MTAPTINEALDQFLAAQHERLAGKTYARYADIIELLRMTLDSYGHLLDYHLGRKLAASKQLYRDASTVTKRLAKWLGDQGHIDEREQAIAVMHAAEAADNWQLDDIDPY